MLRCYIEGRNLIDNSPKRYDITDGAVFTENYNETLDSGTIIIQQLTSKIEIEPYDVMVIISVGGGITINSKRMCVDTYTCTQTSLNPPIYKYEISLFSETKLLEGIICPSLAITKNWGNSKSVYDYIERYIDLYGPKLYSNSTSGVYGDKFSLGSTLNRFRNIQCPEMQWNEPNLREVLNDLMIVDDCIPVIRNNVIQCIDISEIGNEISDEKKMGINYIQETQSSEDYVSEIKMHLVNSANNSIPTGEYSDINDSDIPNDSTRIVERIGFRNNETYILTTENMLLQTSFPIWKLFYCKCYFKLQISFRMNVSAAGHDADVTQTITTNAIGRVLKDSSVDYIPEYAKWLTKDVLYGSWDSSNQDLSENHRNTCLFYTRGSKNIQNFNNKVEYQFLWIKDTTFVWDLIANGSDMSSVALEYVRAWVADYNAQGQGQYFATLYEDSVSYSQGSFKDAEFEVSYEPIDECTFMASKSTFPRNKRVIVDNQTNSYIDVNRQGLLEYLKANRLGNKMIMINGRYQTNESSIPQLSEKVNDKIIFKKQISVYKDHLDVNYLATENYVLRNYFTGVKSKIRSWRILSGNEALLRSELIKFYVNDNISSIVNSNMVIPSYSNLDYYFNRFKYCVIQFNTSEGTKPSGISYDDVSRDLDSIMVEFSKHKIGNSVVFTIRMNDNYYNGNYVSDYNGTEGRVEQKGIGYADSNGEVIGGVICFYSENPAVIYNDDAVTRGIKPLTKIQKYGDSGAQNLTAQIPFTVFKDNKEILQISIQFELNEDANDMFLGKK